MARREVTAEEVSFDGTFLKFGETFPGPGSKFQGIYQSDAPNKFDGLNYTFKLRDGSLGILGVKGPLKAQLAKAKPVKGELVTILRGQDNAAGYYTFRVTIDDPPKGGKPAQKTAPKSSAASEEWGDANEDIPF